MNYIKKKLRTKMGQKCLNDCLVTFIEREFFLQARTRTSSIIFKISSVEKLISKLSKKTWMDWIHYGKLISCSYLRRT
jgi:hypothetical protein